MEFFDLSEASQAKKFVFFLTHNLRSIILVGQRVLYSSIFAVFLALCISMIYPGNLCSEAFPADALSNLTLFLACSGFKL